MAAVPSVAANLLTRYRPKHSPSAALNLHRFKGFTTHSFGGSRARFTGRNGDSYAIHPGLDATRRSVGPTACRKLADLPAKCARVTWEVGAARFCGSSQAFARVGCACLRPASAHLAVVLMVLAAEGLDDVRAAIGHGAGIVCGPESLSLNVVGTSGLLVYDDTYRRGAKIGLAGHQVRGASRRESGQDRAHGQHARSLLRRGRAGLG